MAARTCAFVVFAVLASFTLANPGADVLVLTTENFDEALKTHPNILVDFYAPWCGHCKKLEPEYSRAATTLLKENVKLAAVDATIEKELGTRFGVKGFPTLKFFRNGEASDYTGGRTHDTIVSWLKKKTGPAAKKVDSVEDLEAFKSASDVSIIAFVSGEGSDLSEFIAVASADDEFSYAYTTDDTVAAHFGVTFPSVVLFKNFDELKNVHNGAISKLALQQFVAEKSVPLVTTFTMDNAAKIFQNKLGKVVFMFSKTELPEFRLVAEKYQGKFFFAQTDGKEARLNSHVGVTEAEFPKLFILETGAQMKKFPLSGPVSETTISAHLDEYLAGNLKPHYKSEEVPADNNGDVTVVVGKNFAEVVLDASKDVLLEVYAPWCGHCKKLEPIYEELGAAFKNDKNVVIAKMDGTANEVDGLSVRGFPTIKFYPASKGKRAVGTDFQGDRTLEGLRDYINKERKSAPAESSHEEL